MGNDDSPRPGWSHWAAMRGQGEAVDPSLNIDGQRHIVNGYVTDVLTDQVVAFLKDNSHAPFMVFLAHKALHPNIVQGHDDARGAMRAGQPEGFVPAPRHAGRYATATVPRRPNALAPIVRKPALQRNLPGLPALSPTTGTSDTDIRAWPGRDPHRTSWCRRSTLRPRCWLWPACAIPCVGNAPRWCRCSVGARCPGDRRCSSSTTRTSSSHAPFAGVRRREDGTAHVHRVP